MVRYFWLWASLRLGGEMAVPEPIPAASARKTIMGKLPRRDVKKAVMARLDEWKVPKWTEDERDAFVIANEGRFRCGLVGLGVPARR